MLQMCCPLLSLCGLQMHCLLPLSCGLILFHYCFLQITLRHIAGTCGLLCLLSNSRDSSLSLWGAFLRVRISCRMLIQIPLRVSSLFLQFHSFYWTQVKYFCFYN
ncbi:hypothetical protein AAHE18_05G201400 [Arachis hypogaea]